MNVLQTQNSGFGYRAQVPVLRVLEVFENRISGTLPPSNNWTYHAGSPHARKEMMSFLSPSLTLLDLHGQRLSGSLPPYMQQMKQLSLLDMGTTALKGWMQLPTGLKYVSFGANRQISGTIAGDRLELLIDRLNYFHVGSSSRISGTMPAVMQALSLNSLDVANTALSGTIPACEAATCYALQSATYTILDFDSTALSGTGLTCGVHVLRQGAMNRGVS